METATWQSLRFCCCGISNNHQSPCLAGSELLGFLNEKTCIPSGQLDSFKVPGSTEMLFLEVLFVTLYIISVLNIGRYIDHQAFKNRVACKRRLEYGYDIGNV